MMCWPSIKDFANGAAIGDGFTDASPAWNDAVTELQKPRPQTTLYLPPGNYRFCSAPADASGLRILGDTKSTILTKAFHGGAFLRFSGKNGLTAGGVEQLSLWALAGYAPGSAIVLQGDTVHQPDATVFRELIVTGPGLWDFNFFADGLARTRPQGIREVRVDHCDFFNTTIASVWLANVVGFEMYGGGCFPGAAPYAGCGIHVRGGGATLTNSVLVDFSSVKNNGVLDISNTLSLDWRGGVVGSVKADEGSHFRVSTLALTQQQ